MKNIYTDRLDLFSLTEILAALNAVGVETQRLEFKRQIQPKKLAHKVCSFANASGGIIAIGIEDPSVGKDLQATQTPTDISDKKQLSYTSSINAWVYPQPPFEIHPYRDPESGCTLLVVRVGSSTVGPHEYMGSDESNLPIRRGTETKSLGRTDIEALQRRRDKPGQHCLRVASQEGPIPESFSSRLRKKGAFVAKPLLFQFFTFC